ncbi:MAG: hypothetical protein J6W63_01865 [Treponema sp.]|nr:hypothetical protein [Treponema sp.]
MTKSTFTILFTLVSTIINIILTVATIAILAVAFLFTCKMIGCKNGNVVYMGLLVCFVVGVFLNFYLFSKLTVWAVKKFNLAPKLSSSFVARQLPNGAKFTSQVSEPKKKTVMPKSVLESEEEEKWTSGNPTYQNFGIDELKRGLEKNNEEAQALIKEREEEARAWEELKKNKSQE